MRQSSQLTQFTFQVRLDSVTDKNVCYIINTHLQEGYGQGKNNSEGFNVARNASLTKMKIQYAINLNSIL